MRKHLLSAFSIPTRLIPLEYPAERKSTEVSMELVRPMKARLMRSFITRRYSSDKTTLYTRQEILTNRYEKNSRFTKPDEWTIGISCGRRLRGHWLHIGRWTRRTSRLPTREFHFSDTDVVEIWFGRRVRNEDSGANFIWIKLYLKLMKNSVFRQL